MSRPTYVNIMGPIYAPRDTLTDDEIHLKIKLYFFPQEFVDIWINTPIKLGAKIASVSQCKNSRESPRSGFCIQYSVGDGVTLHAYNSLTDAENCTNNGDELHDKIRELVRRVQHGQPIENVTGSESAASFRYWNQLKITRGSYAYYRGCKWLLPPPNAIEITPFEYLKLTGDDTSPSWGPMTCYRGLA